jgi:hypothetical protein
VGAGVTLAYGPETAVELWTVNEAIVSVADGEVHTKVKFPALLVTPVKLGAAATGSNVK